MLPNRIMNDLDYFGLKSSADLFGEAKKAMEEYHSDPTERLFLFLVFSLNHLREWIAGCSYSELKQKKDKGIELSDNERFFYDIWGLNEFRTVNSLCNRGKHYLTTQTNLKTSSLNGFRCGIGRCGDSLDQEYFLIDNVDSRNIFSEVINKYQKWFDKNG